MKIQHTEISDMQLKKEMYNFKSLCWKRKKIQNQLSKFLLDEDKKGKKQVSERKERVKRRY